MGLTKKPDGKLYILPLPKHFGYREHYKPIRQECNLPNKVSLRYISVWNEDKAEWQSLQCGEKLYTALEEARAELKKKYPFREPIVVLKGTDVRIKPAEG